MRIECTSDDLQHPAATAAEILLLPGRAAVLPATRTLLVSDLHLGKAATFRRAGIPMPEGSTQEDLARLERLVARHQIRRLLIVGDLFHAKSGCTDQVREEFAATRSRMADTEIVLVIGNHDRSLGRLPADIGIDASLPFLDEPPFHFIHEPSNEVTASGRDLFTISGHLHPTLTIRSPSGDRISDRCFVSERGLLVLPAFGSFTGGQRILPTDGMRLWIARDDGVVEVTRLAQLSDRGSRR